MRFDLPYLLCECTYIFSLFSFSLDGKEALKGAFFSVNVNTGYLQLKHSPFYDIFYHKHVLISLLR